MAKFTMLLAYAMALAFALAASGLVPVTRIAELLPQDLLLLRVVTGAILLLVVAIGHFLSGPSLNSRDAFDRHAWLVFSGLAIVSWLAFIDTMGDALHQRGTAGGAFTVAGFAFGTTRYATPLGREISTVARWTGTVGLLGSLVTGWRITARRRKAEIK